MVAPFDSNLIKVALRPERNRLARQLRDLHQRSPAIARAWYKSMKASSLIVARQMIRESLK